MNEIQKKRFLMESCNSLICMMDEVELNTLSLSLNQIINHMIKRGVIVEEEAKGVK